MGRDGKNCGARIEIPNLTHYNFSKYYAKCKPQGAKNQHFLGNAMEKLCGLCWKFRIKSDIMDVAEHGLPCEARVCTAHREETVMYGG